MLKYFCHIHFCISCINDSGNQIWWLEIRPATVLALSKSAVSYSSPFPSFYSIINVVMHPFMILPKMNLNHFQLYSYGISYTEECHQKFRTGHSSNQRQENLPFTGKKNLWAESVSYGQNLPLMGRKGTYTHNDMSLQWNPLIKGIELTCLWETESEVFAGFSDA